MTPSDETRDDPGAPAAHRPPRGEVEGGSDAAPPAPLLPPWARRLAHSLDDLVRIPGTDVGIGLDGVLGFLLPGVGDAVTGAGSVALLLLALRERVPTVILGRMLLNIAIDLVVGVVPVVGDLFDVLFRSNRLNLALIERYRRGADGVPTATDYLIVGLGVGLSVLIFVTPLVLWMLYATVAGVALHQLWQAVH